MGKRVWILCRRGITRVGRGGLTSRLLNGQSSTAGDGLRDAAFGAVGGLVGAAGGKAISSIGQKLAGPAAEFGTLRPGPYANKSVPASGPKVKPSEAAQLRGEPCHTCGGPAKAPRSGNPYGDHQPSTNLMHTKGATRELYPHCATCNGRQGYEVKTQNQQWNQQQQRAASAGAGANSAATRKPENEH